MNEKKARTAAETWNKVQAMGIDDDLEDISSMTDAEIDAELEAAGGDPKAIGERGRELAARLIASRETRP